METQSLCLEKVGKIILKLSLKFRHRGHGFESCRSDHFRSSAFHLLPLLLFVRRFFLDNFSIRVYNKKEEKEMFCSLKRSQLMFNPPARPEDYCPDCHINNLGNAPGFRNGRMICNTCAKNHREAEKFRILGLSPKQRALSAAA